MLNEAKYLLTLFGPWVSLLATAVRMLPFLGSCLLSSLPVITRLHRFRKAQSTREIGRSLLPAARKRVHYTHSETLPSARRGSPSFEKLSATHPHKNREGPTSKGSEGTRPPA